MATYCNNSDAFLSLVSLSVGISISLGSWMFKLKRTIAVATIIGLVSSTIAVADPLAAGKPAGVKQAQMESIPPLVWVALAGMAAAGIAAAASSGNGTSTFNTVAPTTTG
jgi:hypothetical protein